MDIDLAFKSIHSLYQTISTKDDAEVSLHYKGTRFGITKPWLIRIDTRTAESETFDGAIELLLRLLKKELETKVASMELESTRLRKVLIALEN
jgi:hypothetical protein